MDIIFTLTVRYLRQNKKRTAATLAGITAASALLTLSVIFIHSFMKKISTLDAMQADIKKLILAAALMLAVILAVLTFFIYHMLSLSAADKIRHLGILGSVGATPFQRGKLEFYEAVILSILGLPTGLIVGIMISYRVFSFSVEISWGMLLGVLAFEMLVVIITGLIHTFFSVRGNLLQLILNRTEKRDLKGACCLPKGLQRVLSPEIQLAVKNIYFFRKRYSIIGISFFLSALLFLDGFIYLNYQSGNYEPKDPRNKIYADLTVEEEISKKHDNWQSFAEEISSFPEVEEAVLREKIHLGGVLFQQEDVREELDSFTVYDIGSPYKNPTVKKDSGNREEEGVYMNLTLTGLDDASFEQYLRDAGISEALDTDAETIPVIVEDTVLLKRGNSSEYQEFLDIVEGELFSVIADKGRGVLEDTTDIDLANPEETGIEFIQYQFQAITVTPLPPSCCNIIDGLGETNEVHLYTPQHYFEQFFQKYNLEDMREKTVRSVSLKAKNHLSLPDRILYPAVIQKGTSEWHQEYKADSKFLNTKEGDKLQQLLKKYDEPIIALDEKIRSTGELYGFLDERKLDLTDEQYWENLDYSVISYPGWIKSILSDPFPVFRQLFAYTLFIFIAIISAFQMIQMIVSAVYMRKREFAVMLSLGMGRSKIQKMVCTESLICLFSSFVIGCAVSIGIGHLMFSRWTKTQSLEIVFPYQLLWVEVLFLLILIVLSVCVSMRSIRKIQVMDILKGEF